MPAAAAGQGPEGGGAEADGGPGMDGSADQSASKPINGPGPEDGGKSSKGEEPKPVKLAREMNKMAKPKTKTFLNSELKVS